MLDVVRRLEGFDTLLLDRDGVINRLRPGDYVKSIDEFEWLPSVRKALCEAASKFSGIFVVTNQRGVGKGVMSRGELDKIHSWMCSSISEAGGRIDDVYVCTAVADDDPFRKPNTGMFDELLRNHPDVDPARTVMIGDSASDAEFARRCGVSFIKV
ncbi:MAG: HAD-IIIA family hydrolase [Bacteroidales bacterium]|nr:HAD-IIIA family hydrolase [Bacteroidales bacterium]